MRTVYPIPRPGVGPPAPNRPRFYVTESGVPHRAFNASAAIASAAGGVNQLTGDFTEAAVIRRTVSGVEIALSHVTSGFAAVSQLGVHSTAALRFSTATNAFTPTLTLTIADGWAIVVITKVTGTVAPRAHLYKGGSWAHETMGASVANPFAHTGGYTFFASNVGANYAVDVAVAAEWDSVLSDGDIETLDYASQNWADLSPLSLWNFDQTVATDTIPDLAGTIDLTGVTGAPISYDGPRDWDFSVITVHERSASLEASAAISSTAESFTLVTGSAALSATAAIASDGHAILSRSAALSATAAIAASPQRELLRSAAVAATGSITSAATFFSILESAGAITATAAISSASQRDLLRQVALAATAEIVSVGIAEGPGATTHERSASFEATGAIQTAGQRDLLRSASIDAIGTITTAPQRALSRSASLSAIAEIASSGEIQGAVTRSASLTASATISTSPQRALSRSAALAAVAAIASTPRRELLRSAALSASAGIAANGNAAHVLAGAASLSAVADIASTGQVALIFERSAALTALAEITAAEGDVGQFRWANQTDNEWITVPDP